MNVANERDRFELIKRVVIKDRAEDFRNISMEFHFKNPKEAGKDPRKLIFARKDSIIEFDWNTEELETIVKF